jgi:glutathione S-transferase
MTKATKKATLTINSKNYGSWSLRGWLLCKLSGIDFDEEVLPADDAASRAELLLLSTSFLVPRLVHGAVTVWDTLAIGEYLNELVPAAGLLPADPVDRARCRSISGEMHSGFANLRAALPMNIRADHPDFKVWTGAQADIDRVTQIWNDCLNASGGPYLFGASPTVADAMYAPVCTRFRTYHVKLDDLCERYCATILSMPAVKEWMDAALVEPDQLDELDVEF